MFAAFKQDQEIARHTGGFHMVPEAVSGLVSRSIRDWVWPGLDMDCMYGKVARLPEARLGAVVTGR